MGELNIAEFYRGRSVLITGGTGFIGKILVEKLLRCCPEIERIYLLIRPLRNKDVDQRQRELIDNEVFKLLSPQIVEKIVAVSGDVTLPGFGLSLSNLQLLIDHVSIVFNVAATGALEENLNEALETNVQGPTTLLGICGKMKQLQALVHVSTVFNNHFYRTAVEECVYPFGINERINASSCDVIKRNTNKLMKDNNWNVYTFTKVLAERMLEKERGDIPLVIVRPSNVIAAAQEPITLESIDYMTETIDVMLGAGKVFVSDNSLVCDMIPVDYAVNLIIAIAWYTALNRPEIEARLEVYNSSSSHDNPLTWGKFNTFSTSSTRNIQVMNDFLSTKSNLFCAVNKAWLKIHIILLYFHLLLPAYLLDLYRLVTLKRPPQWVQSFRKMHRRMKLLAFFSRTQTHSSNNKFTTSSSHIRLLDELSESDRQTFYFDARKIAWDAYLEKYALGICKDRKDESTRRAERIKMMVKPALGYSHWISLLLVGILAYFWLNNLVDVTVATRSDGDPFNNVLSNNFEMLQNFFSELHIVIAAIMSFAYVCIFIPICLIYALNKFMREFLKIADNFINIPEVKQVIKMCTM